MAKPHSLPIDGQRIDLWLSYYQDIIEEQLLSQLRTFLNEAERTQETRFHFANDRRRYLITRAMVRTVLSSYASIAPNDWTFSTNAHGRPEIANHLDSIEGLRFNISHTRGLIVLGVTRNRAIGIDVENPAAQSRRSSAEIANRFFSPAEVAELAECAQEHRRERFFEYWTFKEAYIKARGMGLSIPLDKFGFRFPDEHTVRLETSPELGDNANRWRFWQLRPGNEYLLAICAERLEGAEPTLTIRKTIPTVADERLEMKCLKTSG